jgi:S-DNA-T family DNA segregation ATPase FtsK/SpoIIIE
MKNFNDWKSNRLNHPLRVEAETIEKTLDSYGIKMRVVEVHKQEKSVIFCLEMVVGTKIDEIEKRQRELALALASPTGKIGIQAPIPGRSLIGIELPYADPKHIPTKPIFQKSFLGNISELIGDIFLFIAYIFAFIGEKLHEVK